MKIIALGCGNMSSAIILGASAKLGPALEVQCYTPSQDKARALAAKVKGKYIPELTSQLDWAQADFILIGCKPQQVGQLADELRPLIPADTKIVSILAGTPVEKLQRLFNTRAVTRIMPSTPTLVGKGISLVLHASEQSAQTRVQIEEFFTSCSSVHPMKTEAEFDLATTVAACGPAYVFNFARALELSLTERGLESGIAANIVRELFSGSSELMNARAVLSLQELQEQVTSKGGITWEAIKVFDSYSLKKISGEAISAALKRTEELKRLS